MNEGPHERVGFLDGLCRVRPPARARSLPCHRLKLPLGMSVSARALKNGDGERVNVDSSVVAIPVEYFWGAVHRRANLYVVGARALVVNKM